MARCGRRLAPALLAFVLVAGLLHAAAEEPRAGAEPARSALGSDFNGDGYADLAVNVNSEDGKDTATSDAIVVLYGSAQGLQHSGRQRPSDDLVITHGPGAAEPYLQTMLLLNGDRSGLAATGWRSWSTTDLGETGRTGLIDALAAS